MNIGGSAGHLVVPASFPILLSELAYGNNDACVTFGKVGLHKNKARVVDDWAGLLTSALTGIPPIALR
jgi:hypothetical protein